VPKNQVLGYLAGSHVCVLCTWPHPFLGTVLQNKIFDYMAASRPIVAAVHGELAALIDTADCGWVVSPGDPDALARICLDLASTDASVLRAKGANGRAFVDRHYRRSHLADRALAAMTSTMPRSPGSPAHYSLEP
jgi:glycosyltransferase involved in cell wall biosynthesis